MTPRLLAYLARRLNSLSSLTTFVFTLQANNVAACRRACEIENEIMCRSFLYRGPPTGTTYNCQLFHLDHVTLPDGVDTFLSTDRPLLDIGREPGVYYENICKSEYPLVGSPLVLIGSLLSILKHTF